MMIPYRDVYSILSARNIIVTGVFHIGAHECEELPFYNSLGVKNEHVIWIDAIPSKVSKAINRGVPNVYNALVTDKDDEEVVLNVSSNFESSSVLEFGTHSQEYPHIVYVDKVQHQSITVDTFFKRNNLDASRYNLWNFDIQGAELMALKGAQDTIKYAKALYLEVNEKELYKNCGLITEIDEFLSQHKFKRIHTVMTEQGWGDAIYIR